jgi:hypothetical protein
MLVTAYVRLVRPRYLRWGATAEEAGGPMPGDELVGEPTLVSTRAISIASPPGSVWPWVAQLGQGRGGFYSYDWIENLIGLDIHSADRVMAEFQRPVPGDRIALAPDGWGLDVERVEDGRLLVLREPGGGLTWTFMLAPEEGGTRLVVRNRWTTAGRPLPFRLLMALIEPSAFVMEQKMLRGIRQRAERAA